MRLTSVNILNFRSIDYIELSVEPRCQILVGINESGKSNILKALSLLDESNNFYPSDVREPKPEGDSIDKSYVNFNFSLEPEEIDSIWTKLKVKVLTKNINTSILNFGKTNYNFKEFCKLRAIGQYSVNIKENKRNSYYFLLGVKYCVLKNWRKPSTKCPKDFAVESSSNRQELLSSFILVNIDEYTSIPEDYLEPITAEEINRAIGTEISALIKSERPKTIFWNYDEMNLLPANVDLNDFTKDPNICIPLRSMFELAEINNISDEIDKAISKGKFGLRNILNRVAENTTKHFRSIWKDYSNIEFSLAKNGEIIEISIKDKYNHYEISQRSDGFKRFITFLLLISAKVASNSINNALIVIDEPDIGLHPSGIRCLRDELINISKNNYVFFSTHSIFMIDKENIERHLLVEKSDEITKISRADSSNIYDEEVIYNALGYSTFDALKPCNIIFEGWTDKKLYQTALKRVPSAYKGIKESFKNYGYCHANGVKHIKSVASILELADRQYFIISDSDKPAMEKQKEYKDLNFYGIWKRYNELYDDTPIITSEDFVKPSAFKSVIREIKDKYALVKDLKIESLVDLRGKVWVLDQWLGQEITEKSTKSEAMKEIKINLFENLKSSDIEDIYYIFLQRAMGFLSNI